MSGGFFRGTSADQDTRFSNKQAKLMKSQKFAPELDHLVDMSKVKIDTVKPWIAKRVTELLGFEDEVLINFIYGLLDKKEVNGKEVQIQLTGFMEKNTGKFMKELWALLLSAQKNASGIPQQILDATDEELKKKKVEADRITHEIQKRKEKEGREYEQEKLKKMDGEVDVLRATNAAPGPISRHLQPRESGEDKEADERNGPRGKSRVSISPKSGDRSPSSNRSIPSRSISRSLSNSRSYSDEKHKSRSISRSPQSRGFSISPERRYRSQRRRSISPRHRPSPRRPRSPLRRRSPHSRRRSPSHSRRRSPSPIRRKSPPPIRRRSPSPVRRRSPFMRRRSPPPLRRRSPSPPRRRSPSLVRRRSPVFVRRRSPTPSWRRSPSPVRWRSPSPLRRRSPSPVRRRSPLPRSPRYRRRSPVRSPRQRNRSRSPYRSHSPAYQSRRSLSRDHDLRSNGVESRSRDDYASQRIRGKMSPVRNATERDGQARKGLDSVSHQPPITLRSPQRDPSDARIKKPALLHSPGLSQRSSESSPHMEKMSPSEDRSPSESPVRQTKERISHRDSPSPVRQARERVTRHGSPETSGEEEEFSRIREDGDRGNHFSQRRIRRSPIVGNPKNSPMKDFSQEEYSPEIFGARRSTEAQHHPDDIELRKNDREKQSVKASMRAVRPGSPTEHTLPTYGEVEYGPGRPGGETFLLDNVQDGHPSANKHERDVPPSSERLQKSCSREGYKTDEKKHSRSSNVEDGNRGHKTETLQKSMKRVDRKNGIDASDSDSEKNEKYRSDYMEKRKHKRSGRHEMASDDHADDGSEIDERKEAKRRRKEEKRLRKEERRRRREERHRRREDRRAGKLKAKSMDTVTPPSDFEKNQDADDSDSNVDVRKESHPSDIEETESEQKKLEIELRKKALESLKAKKGISQ